MFLLFPSCFFPFCCTASLQAHLNTLSPRQSWSLTTRWRLVSCGPTKRRRSCTRSCGSTATRPRSLTCARWPTLGRACLAPAVSSPIRRTVTHNNHSLFPISRLFSFFTSWAFPLLNFLSVLFHFLLLLSILFSSTFPSPSILLSLGLALSGSSRALDVNSTQPPRTPRALFSPARLGGTMWGHKKLQHGIPL